MKELGELLRELRGKRSLRDIAKITDLSHSYIADVEKGYKHGTKVHIVPSPDTLMKLSEAYNYDYEELMQKAGHLKKGISPPMPEGWYENELFNMIKEVAGNEHLTIDDVYEMKDDLKKAYRFIKSIKEPNKE